jgi:hypothetical protein
MTTICGLEQCDEGENIGCVGCSKLPEVTPNAVSSDKLTWVEIFPQLVQEVLDFARKEHPVPFHGLYEGLGVLLKEQDQLQCAIFRGKNSKDVLIELASVAAMCQRIAEDICLQKNA